jgi:hypothetical protein
MKQADDFFRYSRERHNVYLQRRNGDPAPWTEDPVMNCTSFTNIFRELDRVTIWFRQNIRDRLSNTRHIVPWTTYFRWFNRITTGEVLVRYLNVQDPGCAPFDRSLLEEMIRDEIPKGPWVTGAYMVCSGFGNGDKLTGMLNFCQLFDDWWSTTGQYEFYNDLNEPQLTMQEAHKLLVPRMGLSGFTAYEVVTDLRYTGAIDPRDRNKWAHAGPGATRGGSRVEFGEPYLWSQGNRQHQACLVELMQELLRMSRKVEWWPQNDPDWPRWEMRDVEHTLCEFDKYERVRREQGRAKKVFKPSLAGPLLDAKLGGL